MKLLIRRDDELTVDEGVACDLLTLRVFHWERRGRGYGSRVVAAFAEHAAASGYPWAVLSCKPERRAFYERLGWGVAEGGPTIAVIAQGGRQDGRASCAARTPSASSRSGSCPC